MDVHAETRRVVALTQDLFEVLAGSLVLLDEEIVHVELDRLAAVGVEACLGLGNCIQADERASQDQFAGIAVNVLPAAGEAVHERQSQDLLPR